MNWLFRFYLRNDKAERIWPIVLGVLAVAAAYLVAVNLIAPALCYFRPGCIL